MGATGPQGPQGIQGPIGIKINLKRFIEQLSTRTEIEVEGSSGIE